ncbi:hypothetical protein BDV18DRAFT_141264 [Aspergillus unguis]
MLRDGKPFRMTMRARSWLKAMVGILAGELGVRVWPQRPHAPESPFGKQGTITIGPCLELEYGSFQL